LLRQARPYATGPRLFGVLRRVEVGPFLLVVASLEKLMFDSNSSPAAIRTRRSFAHGVVGLALAGAGWLGGAGAALAANANFNVVVTQVPASVSVSRPGLTTYAAYTVSITNTAGNTNNNIRFSGSTTVTGDLTAADGDAGAVATYIETIPRTACTPRTGGTSVQCNFSQMKAGANNSFVVIFAAPALADADHYAADAAVNFNWSFDYASGNSSGTPSSIICNGVQLPNPPCTGTNSTALITTQTDAILSGFLTYVPSFGGTFFTGNGASALPASGTNLRPTALTKLTIPTGQNLTTAQAALTVAAGGLTSDTTTTIDAIFTVPSGGFFGHFATVELRRDASTIANGAKIANAVVLYSHDDNPSNANPVPACPANGDPSSLSPPVCLFSRTEFTKKNAPTSDDIGDWLFVIHADENGGFRF
jgi:hypothetical protein